MLHILKMAAFTLSELWVSAASEDSIDGGGKMRAFGLLATAHIANLALVLMVWFPALMDAVGRNRNAAVLLVGLLGWPYYFLIEKLISSARKEFGEDEVAAVEARRRWRLPVLLYLVVSWILFVGEIVVLASR